MKDSNLTPTSKKLPLAPCLPPSNAPRWSVLITWALLLSAVLALCGPARAENAEAIAWGVMDWKNDASFPNTDTNPAHPLFGDGGCGMICHQYQSPNWLASKLSSTNLAEIGRIYDAGYCINLMLYFVSCTHDTVHNTFSYPLNDQFLADYAQLLGAYKTGGGPLYIQVFPEFELWYSGKSSTEQDQYRQKIRDQFAAMVNITRTNYNKAYIGLCFMGADFTGDTSQFGARFGSVLTNSDVVWVNSMTPYTQWYKHAEMYIKATQLLSTNWGLPLIFPYVDLWDDSNTPIFGQTGQGYPADAQFFSNCITNWVGHVFNAPQEVTSGATTNWATNLRTLKSRNFFGFSYYSANYCNKPTTPLAPNGVSYALESYTMLTNLMWPNARSYLYPIDEVEYWQNVTNAPVASPSYSVVSDVNCSSGQYVLLNSTAANQYVSFNALVSHPGTYDLRVGLKKQSSDGIFQLSVANYPQGSTVDLYSANDSYCVMDFGTKTFNASGWKPFTFTVVGKNPSSSGYALGVDFIQLIPQSSGPFDIVQDSTDGSGVTLTGSWTPSASTAGYYGANYLHDGNTGKGSKSVRYTPAIPSTSSVEVFVRWTAHYNRANNVPIDIIHAGGTTTVTVNQQQNGGQWYSLGTYTFNAGTGGSVLLRTTGTSGYVVADAVRFRQQ